MCTISWFYTPSGYHVFFNRDEAKTRARAELPEPTKACNTTAIMPIDPQGGGTWCAVNEYGFTFALLNFYQGRWPKGRLTSRGQIVKQCAQFNSLSDATGWVRRLPLHKFAPFSLLCFTPERPCTDTEDSVLMLRWTGKQLLNSTQLSPLISSAVHFEAVSQSRMAILRTLIAKTDSDSGKEVALRTLHSSHQPSRSAYSVCMHREDAETASLSHVQVMATHIRYAYTDGPRVLLRCICVRASSVLLRLGKKDVGDSFLCA